MSEEQTPITEERLKEIEERANNPANDQAFLAFARTDVGDLVTEIHRLWAKVQEQESTIALPAVNLEDIDRRFLASIGITVTDEAVTVPRWVMGYYNARGFAASVDWAIGEAFQVMRKADPADSNQGEGNTPPAAPKVDQGLPHYDHGETVPFILGRMMDTERPHGERFPEDLIDEGCICRRLIENVLDWQQVHIEQQNAIDAEDAPAPTDPQ